MNQTISDDAPLRRRRAQSALGLDHVNRAVTWEYNDELGRLLAVSTRSAEVPTPTCDIS